MHLLNLNISIIIWIRLCLFSSSENSLNALLSMVSNKVFVKDLYSQKQEKIIIPFFILSKDT